MKVMPSVYRKPFVASFYRITKNVCIRNARNGGELKKVPVLRCTNEEGKP